MKKTDVVILKKIIGYCDNVEELMIKFDKDFNTFKKEIAFQYSCNMCIMQIGELTTRISDEIKSQNKTIPWSAIKTMRNIQAHDYEHVDMEIVWETLQQDIPALRDKIKALLTEGEHQ